MLIIFEELTSLSAYVFISILFALLLLSWLAFRPYFKLQFYKKQGIPVHFFPLVGPVFLMMKHVKTKGDFLAIHKETIKEQPNLKCIAGHLGNVISIHLADPALIKEFFSKQDLYQKADICCGVQKLLLGEGLLTSEGEVWKNHRKLISTVFHFEYIKQLVPSIVATVDELITNLAHTKSPEIMIMEEFEKMTGEVVGRIFFGKKSVTVDGKALSKELGSLWHQIFEIVISPSNMLFGAGFIKLGLLKSHRDVVKRITRVKYICNQVLLERRVLLQQANKQQSVTERKTLLDLLLETQLQQTDGKLSDLDIVEEIITFFLTGMDTTGHVLTFCIWLMIQYPDTVPLIQQEISTIMGPDLNITHDNLGRMEYLTGFIQESLRILTPLPFIFLREAKQDHYLENYKIRKGDMVTPEFTLCNMNPKYYDNPDKFCPERWIGSDRPTKNLHPFCFIPFSAGSRNCIGQHLSLIETKIILIKFLSKFDFKLIDGYKMKLIMRALYEPVDDLKIKLFPR